jgi:HIV Tat-specific factor 1
MADEAQQSEVWTFPTDPSTFDSDERISFSRLDNKYIAVVDDGTEYEFDRDLKRWVPIIDEDLIQQQQAGYFRNNDDDDESNQSAQQGKKRKSNDREVSCAPYLQLSCRPVAITIHPCSLPS